MASVSAMIVVNPTVSEKYRYQCTRADNCDAFWLLAAGSTSVGHYALQQLSVSGRDGSRTECCPGLRISNPRWAHGGEHAVKSVKRQPHARPPRDAAPR